MITGKMLRDAIISASITLSDVKAQIDALNVYPVPDGDTGTNMYLTLSNAANELKALPSTVTVAEVSQKAAFAMLRGARGNSGVIISLLFRGFSKAFESKTEASCDDLVVAFELGIDGAYKSVSNPSEGTILTVARETAEAVKSTSRSVNDPITLWADAVATANRTLEQTPDMLPILKKAGVVDAGGKGLCVILEEMLRSFKGKSRTLSDVGSPINSATGFPIDDDTAEITYSYCTEFIITLTTKKADTVAYKMNLEAIGDCVVLVEDGDIIKVHLHTDNPGIAIEKALEMGFLSNIKIDNMKLQREQKAKEEREKAEKEKRLHTPVKAKKKVGFVAVVMGNGIENTFKELGCDAVVNGGQTMNPSADDILKAVYSVPAQTVFVLPNNKNVVMTAEAAMKLSKRNMCVIHTVSIPQGLSAIMSYDEALTIDDNRVNMNEAIKRVQTGQVTYAARNSSFSGHDIKQGDILALENGRLAFTERDVSKAAYRLTKHLVKKLKGAKMVTIMFGADITDENAGKLQELFDAKFSNVDVTFIKGGQPAYYYIISVE